MLVSGRVLVGESERVNESTLVLVNESVSELVNCRVLVSNRVLERSRDNHRSRYLPQGNRNHSGSKNFRI